MKHRQHSTPPTRRSAPIDPRRIPILLGLVLTSLIGAANAATLSVGPGETYTTIQAAINAATADDTITVAAGTYAETVSIEKSITLTGPNASVQGGGARGAEAVVTGGFVLNGVTNVTIAGFSVTGPGGSGIGILIGNTTQTPGPISLTNNIVHEWNSAISLAGGTPPSGSNYWVSGVSMTGNLIANNNSGVGNTENATNLTVQNNIFNNCGLSLAGGSSTAAPVTGNTFTGLTSATRRYFSLAAGVSLAGGQTFANIVANNTFDKGAVANQATGSWYAQAVFGGIGGAVSAAVAGSTIDVLPGTYTDGAVTVNTANLTANSASGVSGYSFTLGTANSLVLAGAGNVNVTGNANANTLTASDGANSINGAAGIDTAVFSSTAPSLTAGSSLTIGSDTVTNVEKLQFSDVTIALVGTGGSAFTDLNTALANTTTEKLFGTLTGQLRHLLHHLGGTSGDHRPLRLWIDRLDQSHRDEFGPTHRAPRQ